MQGYVPSRHRSLLNELIGSQFSKGHAVGSSRISRWFRTQQCTVLRSCKTRCRFASRGARCEPTGAQEIPSNARQIVRLCERYGGGLVRMRGHGSGDERHVRGGDRRLCDGATSDERKGGTERVFGTPVICGWA